MAVLSNYQTVTGGEVAALGDLGGAGYAFASLSGIPFTDQTTGSGFGIVSGSVLTTSRTIVNTLDLLCEGQVEGLVSGEYELSGNIGETGYASGQFIDFGGFPENHLRSIYLNEVSVVSAGQDNKNYWNFQDFRWAISDGEPQGIKKSDTFLNSEEATKTTKTKVINERLYGPEVDGKSYSKNFRLYNKNISSLEINIKIPALSYTKVGSEFTEDEQNKQVGTRIEFHVEYRAIYKDGTAGAWLQNAHGKTDVEGLISSPYLLTISTTPNYEDAEVNKDLLVGWEFKATRLTLDSINVFVQNESYIDSITEVFQTNLSYPNSAILASRFNAEFFSQIPNRAFDMRLLKVKIPSNYDPITRSYYNPDDWNGTFSTEITGPFGKLNDTYVGAARELGKYWTDNPAWVFYDLVTNKRYGLGKYIESINIDKWTLYKIAQYCDVMVDNGEDGVEPRFSCNVLINSREEAFKVLQDFASIFRGIVYYGMGGVQPIQDKEKEPIIQFTNSNVSDGNFSYASSAKKTRFSVAVVRYIDKTNFFKPALEYVEDIDAIRKYGIRETEVTAFGCTSKTQAIRLGRWILHTNNYEQETVNFSAGLDSLLVRPGDVIQISDKNRGINLQGGRIIDVSATGVILDRYANIESNHTYDLSLTTPTYWYDDSLINDGTFKASDADQMRRSQLTKTPFSTALSDWTFSSTIIGTGVNGPISGSVIGFPTGTIPAGYDRATGVSWSIDDRRYEPEYYNVLDVKETDGLQHEITASKHYTGKFAAIESGIVFTPRDPNVVGSASAPPAPLKITGALGDLTVNSKKIDYAVDVPTGAGGVIQLGSTSHYNIYLKTGAAWDTTSTDPETGDFIVNTVPPIPRPQTKIATLNAATSNTKITNFHIPAANVSHYFLAYAFNGAGAPSDGNAQSPAISVAGHNPIRDVSVHSLRLTTDDFNNNTISKGAVIKPKSKDQAFTWDASFLGQTPPIELEYVVTIREPLPGSNALTGNIIGGPYTGSRNLFQFPFEQNYALPNGPFRHYDIAVVARDRINGGFSTDAFNPPQSGYDIAEVNNVRPSGFWMTPRDSINQGARPGLCQGDEDLCTEQMITSDGKIYINFRQMGYDLDDIAGGYVYLSATPFSAYEDFTSAPSSPLGGLTGIPANDRSDTLLGVSRYSRLGITNDADARAENKIISIPFTEPTIYSDCACDGTIRRNNTIIVSPDWGAGFSSATNTYDAPNHFNFDKAYYVAMSLFDSFDYAVSGKAAGGGGWNEGLWVGFARPYISQFNDTLGATHANTGLYTTGSPVQVGNPSTSNYILSEEDFLAYGLRDGETPVLGSKYVRSAPWFSGGARTPYQGFTGCPIYPTKFTSSKGMSPYHAWIRINVNGIWEGNGVQNVRILSKKDVENFYGYNGFFDYGCRQDETEYQNPIRYYPNYSDSYSCRFTQGQYDAGSAKYGDWGGQSVQVSATHTATGLRVGVPQFWHRDIYSGEPYVGSAYVSGVLGYAGGIDDDNIPSYNETGAQVYLPDDPTIDATKPLHGFRRFRVYFDEHNLPAPNLPGRLASYTVLGLNAWNGKYTAWPAGSVTSKTSMLFAREGTDIFSTGTVQTWLDPGDIVENIPGVWNHHPAGFGQGYGGLIKNRRYFDVHLGRLIDDSYLEEAFFGVVTTNDYTTALKTAQWGSVGGWSRYDDALGIDYAFVSSQSYDGIGWTGDVSGWYKTGY